jgi:membrane-associated HD superfamily phosphohydrolase
VAAKKISLRDIFLGAIFFLFCGIIVLALLLPILQDLAEPPLNVGDVAPYDIHAPYALTYQSQILTARQQDAAAAAVPIIYSSADTNIARQQLEHLRNTLVFINNVRADSFASLEQKITDLSTLEDIKLDRNTSIAILSLSASRWSAVSEETTTVLDQVMREPKSAYLGEFVLSRGTVCHNHHFGSGVYCS